MVGKKLEALVIQIVADTLKVDKNLISLTSQFVDDLGVDSLDLMELIMMINNTFNCNIPDDLISDSITISDIVKYLESCLSDSDEICPLEE